jgi:hypothetical protein
MNTLSFNFLGALDCLKKHGIGFVLIGGLAANLHGSPTLTQDVDICYERSPGNLDRLATALRAMSARLRGVSEEVPFQMDAKSLAAGDSFTFATDFGSLDCLGTPAGTEGFASLKLNALDIDVGGFNVLVASLDDLISMKRAANRPKDRVEIEILGALREELERRSGML